LNRTFSFMKLSYTLHLYDYYVIPAFGGLKPAKAGIQNKYFDLDSRFHESDSLKHFMLPVIILLLIASSVFPDATYNKNKKANRLYEKGKYAEALSLYEEALVEDPDEKKLSMNKGSAQYRLDDFNSAEESYKNALTVEDAVARADLHYNMGNVYNMQGDQMLQTANQQAMEKYKAARDSYIKSLDLRPNDKDAKWNLQLTQMKIKELEKQQQQQQQDKDQNKQDQDKQNQDQNQDKKDQQQQDKQDQQEKEQEQDKKDQQQQQNPEDQQQEQKPQPKPQKSEEDMEKEEAMRLLQQYADDDKELNKPQKKMKALMGKKPEKDW